MDMPVSLFSEAIFFFLPFVFLPTKAQNSFLFSSKSVFTFSTSSFQILSFFSMTNCFTSLRNLHYSSHKSSRPLTTFLYTSRLALILSLICSSHHLAALLHTIIFSPSSHLATLFTTLSHSITTSFTNSCPFMPLSTLLLIFSENLCTSALNAF